MTRDVDRRQIRAARCLLDWQQKTLAERAGLSLPTVKRIEKDGGASAGSLSAVVGALERGGVEFLPEEGGRGLLFGVALKRS